MTNDEIISSIALTQCPGVGYITAKRLVENLGSASEVFRCHKDLPRLFPGIHPAVVKALDNPAAFERASREMGFAEKHGVACLTLKDEAYPSRLRECEDAPIVLFYKGNVNLNRLHVINMVGTRKATDYGRQFCAGFLRDLAVLCPDVLVVSGLAYGIDIRAHLEAMANGLSTVGVLAHGLDRIYPPVHRNTAAEMVSCGGLLTEYLSGALPDRHNFINRNRIVAGMCDATIVVESAYKGGALITAGLAGSYNRECFAVPGRIDDRTSQGCNCLIRQQKACLLESAESFMEMMGWHAAGKVAKNVQREFFPDLDADEERVVQALRRDKEMHINTLVVETDLPINRMSALLFELELKGVVRPLAGGNYRLI